MSEKTRRAAFHDLHRHDFNTSMAPTAAIATSFVADSQRMYLI
jgi:hypothetical protein